MGTMNLVTMCYEYCYVLAVAQSVASVCFDTAGKLLKVGE